MTALTDIVPLCLHPHDGANVPISLYDGDIVVRHDNGESSGSGRISMCWLPTTGLRLEAEVPPGVPETGGRVTIGFSDSTTEALVSSVQHRFGSEGHSVKIGGPIRSVEIGTPGVVTNIGFQVVNFPDVLTPGKAAAPAFGYPPSVVDLRSGGWRVRLTAVENSTKVFKDLAATGGYAFTHLGRLEREDGSVFSVADAREILDTLPSFLSYARGSSCGIPFCWGVDTADAVIWEQWASATVDAWKTPHTWFDEHHGGILTEIFPAFAKAYKDPDSRDTMQLALHWFDKSNTRAGGMEGAIILGLTSLDLLGAMVAALRLSWRTTLGTPAMSRNARSCSRRNVSSF